MSVSYEQIEKFMSAYFPDYAEKAQDPVLQPAMDAFYAPDIVFDDGVVTSRDQWYRMCLSHPDIVDVLTVDKLCIDVENLTVSAMIVSRPTERATGKTLLEIKMNSFYTLKETEDGGLIITRIQVFTESSLDKLGRMMSIYGMKM